MGRKDAIHQLQDELNAYDRLAFAVRRVLADYGVHGDFDEETVEALREGLKQVDEYGR